MIFHLGNNPVDLDTEKTKRIYRDLPAVTQVCDCDGCRNFERAADLLPSEVHTFFGTMGVDPKKITECYVYRKNEDGSLLYGGFYHVCGTLLEDTSERAGVESDSRGSDLFYRLNDAFRVSFHKECLMVEPQFEAPTLQVEIEATLPWVLDVENTY